MKIMLVSNFEEAKSIANWLGIESNEWVFLNSASKCYGYLPTSKVELGFVPENIYNTSGIKELLESRGFQVRGQSVEVNSINDSNKVFQESLNVLTFGSTSFNVR